MSQKIHAIKTFALPTLDYALTEGKVKVSTMKRIDKKVREAIKKHIKSNLPNEVFYTHWKDGGLSLQPLEERMYTLRMKTFIALLNSQSTKTKALMKEFVKDGKRYRNIPIRVIGSNDSLKNPSLNQH